LKEVRVGTATLAPFEILREIITRLARLLFSSNTGPIPSMLIMQEFVISYKWASRTLPETILGFLDNTVNLLKV